jgi:anaerobic magnesium-protoporphyrin IX monomethyl ester cyclase
MIDVLLTQSYFMHFDPKQERAMMPYPPLGTLYAAAVLESDGFAVQLFDTMLAKSEQELRAALERHRPKVVVIYDDDFNYLTKMCLTRMREAAFTMSCIAKEFGATVFVHGSDASDHYEKYLAHGADAVVIGEGETTLLELCRGLLRCTESDWHRIDGLAFFEHATVQKTRRREIRKDLDALPFPAWHLVDHERYRALWKQRHGYYSVNMVTTRGCPFHCNWCAKPVYGQVYHARSAENVAEEMRYLQQTIRPDHIWFADDIFGLKPGWVQQFAAVVHDRGIRIPFKIQSRADLLTHENTVEALASAGCADVWIGAESGSQKILDAMEKGTTIAQIATARALLREHRVNASFFLQFGYLGETADDIRATIRMVKDLMPDDIGISVSYPLPGTKFYELVRTDLRQKQNWIDSDDLAMMYRSTYSPEYYKRLHRYVHKAFRIRQAFTFIGEMMRFRHAPTKKYLRRVAGLARYLPGIAMDRVKLFYLSGKSHGQSSGPAIPNPEAAAAAFSEQAPMFDSYERTNPILQWMRSQVHRQMEAYVRPGDSLLDISAGTGIDAVHFALQGHPVRALDVAEGMVAEIRKKAAALHLDDRIDAERLSYTQLQHVRSASYDHVLSNFGGLNCTPDLRPVAAQLKRLVRPGGTVTMMIMPAVCPWEVLHLVKGKFSFAFRRFKPNGAVANIDGHRFLTYYHSPMKVIKSFGPEFQVLKLRGVGSLSPPPYMERLAVRFPRAYQMLTALDERLGSYPPFNRWADHYILTLMHAESDRPETSI